MDHRLEKPIIIVDAAKAFPAEDLPGAVLTNEGLSDLMAQVKENLLHSSNPRSIEISDVDFPFDRIGIRSRRILDCLFGVYDIAAAASQKITLKRQDLDKLKLIIVATITADRIVPCVAASRQTAKASGRILSNVSPSAMRVLNTFVCAASCSSVISAYTGANFSTSLAVFSNFLTARRLPQP